MFLSTSDKAGARRRHDGSQCGRGREAVPRRSRNRQNGAEIGGVAETGGGTAAISSDINVAPAPIVFASTLAIPRVSAKIPSQIGIVKDANILADLASELLACGVLQELDWLGESLYNSVRCGVERWVNIENKCGALEHFSLVFTYVQDINETYANYILHGGEQADRVSFEEAMRKQLALDDAQIFGAFTLCCEAYSDVIIGQRLVQLEGLAEGAGWSVLHTLSRALWCSTGGGTFGWTLNEVAERDYGDEEAEGAEWLTDGKIEAILPPEALRPVFTKASVEKALRKRSLHAWHKAVLREALALQNVLELLGRTALELDQSVHLNEPNFLPVLLRWSTDDGFDGPFDEYHDALQQTGEGTTICYLRGWSLGLPDMHPGSVASAVRTW